MNDTENAKIKENNVLVVLLSIKPTLLILEDCPKSFVVHKTEYKDVYDSDWTGFYDWKRDLKGNIIGVTHFTFGDYQLFIKHIRSCADSLPNIRFQEGPTVDINFSNKLHSDEDTSGEQLFGNNRIYVSEKGDYAMSFGLNRLTNQELKSLELVDLL